MRDAQHLTYGYQAADDTRWFTIQSPYLDRLKGTARYYEKHFGSDHDYTKAAWADVERHLKVLEAAQGRDAA